MAKPQIHARIDEDVAAEVERFAEEKNLSQSEATRRLVLTGLDSMDRAPEGVVAGEVKRVTRASLYQAVNLGLLLSIFLMVWRTSIVMAGGTTPDILVGVDGWLLLGGVWVVIAVVWAASTFLPGRLDFSEFLEGRV